MSRKINIGLIGFGRMGNKIFKVLDKSDKWNVSYICDLGEESRQLAAQLSPNSKIVADEDEIFNDPSVDAVALYALADSRYEQACKAVKSGKHILSEKPIASKLDDEKRLVDIVENTNVISAANLYLRNSWYHNTIKDFVASGEIGDLAIIRVCHMTPGLAPGEGHRYEGPSFHDCGMHYVDIARWYAESEYATWDAQAMRMWNYKDPWWLQCHGTFENGIVFDITQGFVYGQLSKDQTHNSYVDIIGTKGIARMTHDFKTAVVELRGTSVTERIEKPFGGKNLDVLCDVFADAVMNGKRDPRLPSFRDAAKASEYAWKFLDSAWCNRMPAKGDLETLEQIKERRRHMTNGYGLLSQR